MCLAVPGKVIEFNKEQQWAVIEALGVKNKVYTVLIDEDISLGDYLMVHAGHAIGKIEMGDAHATLELLKEISNAE
jgi:hydrogenase expression/formation protein HypC